MSNSAAAAAATTPPTGPVGGGNGTGPFRVCILTVKWLNVGSAFAAQQIAILVTAGFTLNSCVYLPPGPACSSELLQYTFTSVTPISTPTIFRGPLTGDQLNAFVFF